MTAGSVPGAGAGDADALRRARRYEPARMARRTQGLRACPRPRRAAAHRGLLRVPALARLLRRPHACQGRPGHPDVPPGGACGQLLSRREGGRRDVRASSGGSRRSSLSSRVGRGVRPWPGAPGCWPRPRVEDGRSPFSLLRPNIDLDIDDLLERNLSFCASSAATLSFSSFASAFRAAFSMRRDMTVDRFRASTPTSTRSRFSRATSFSSARARFAVPRTFLISSRAESSFARLFSRNVSRLRARCRASTSRQRRSSHRASAASARTRSCRNFQSTASGADRSECRNPSPTMSAAEDVPKSSVRISMRGPIARRLSGYQCRSCRGQNDARTDTVTSRPNAYCSARGRSEGEAAFAERTALNETVSQQLRADGRGCWIPATLLVTFFPLMMSANLKWRKLSASSRMPENIQPRICQPVQHSSPRLYLSTVPDSPADPPDSTSIPRRTARKRPLTSSSCNPARRSGAKAA